MATGDRFFLYTPVEPPPLTLPGNFILRRVPLRRGVPWLNFSLPLSAIRDRVDVMLFPANDCWLLPFRKTVVIILDIAQRTHLRRDLRPLDRLQNDLQLAMLPLSASRVVAISEYTARQVLALKPSLAGRVSVAHCGLNPAFNDKVPAEQSMARYILFVSGFDKRKNVENLLEAFRLLREKGRREKLLLKGVVEPGIGYYQDVPAMVRERGLEEAVEVDSSYAGDDRLAALYKNAAMLVVPSFIEGFGLPVLEAMACGCPVACSNAASLPEVGGDAALYFDPNDPEQMASVMDRILDEPGLRQSMIDKGFENVKRFSWDKMAGELLELLRTVGGRRQGKAGR
jgi:glycosyltransferase involved in cell wall biosynthesis